MALKSQFWRQTAFQVSMAVCTIFVILTAVAMLVYPGGTKTDHSTPGYSFFQDFFSDLGLTKVWSGESNGISSALFVAALSLAGAMLALFFVAFAQFFNRSFRGKSLSRLGSVAGVISGICFVGIAAALANLHGWAHGTFVNWAFRMFLLAVVLYTAAILVEHQYPETARLGVCAVCHHAGSPCGTDHRRPIIGDPEWLEDTGDGAEAHRLRRHRQHLHPGQRGAEIRPVKVALRRTC